ncbi:DUF1156 domain-containing protein [Nocardia sp. BSTN01]|uniref:DUF1156 domain-containing protein n=1 Tax=Nocardia sp. BSTN01 TaxID=2783665 RepID=UPI00188F7B14|nr:DUF1156 domain-containing protein [Nocardia sp. BSTN01]MBF4998646.1 DUF1156 domain-containing protein [Nocardia sp. BSTN01]
MHVRKRKLIEVALPLEAINKESAREKSIRHGHPSTLHLWWARRPLAAARAVLFAQLVDDPSARPEEFPTEEAQRTERERLHELIERLVVWDNVRDEKLLAEVHAEILKSTDGNPPAILDPFAGGGTIPLEAQRLGLEACASDLNPVAVLINKALIEIPPRFAHRPPVFPGAADSQLGGWPRTTGLTEDVRRYGAWMRNRAEERIGHLYPKATLADGSEATVIAWIWARTVTCPNPACGIQMPLVRSWWLGKKKGKEAYIVPTVVDDFAAPGGRRVEFSIGRDPATAPTGEGDGTVGRTGAECLACRTAVSLDHVRSEGRGGRLSQQLIAVVAEGSRQRAYLPPSRDQVETAAVERPAEAPPGALFDWPGYINVVRYGLTDVADLFSGRQLQGLVVLSDLVETVRERVLTDALAAGLPNGPRLVDLDQSSGVGPGGESDPAAFIQHSPSAEAYADAIASYLALVVSRTVDRSSTIASWDSSRESIRNTFGRLGVPMTWDFCEANLLSNSSGGFASQIDFLTNAVDSLPAQTPGVAEQVDAASREYRNVVVSTDPPYYSNIPYSDFSDYFYVWLRQMLRSVYPNLFSTMVAPKTEELVANPYRWGGKENAQKFFEEGFRQVFTRVRRGVESETSTAGFPITVYYAFKQSDTTANETASTGWETLLEGMIRSGWEITSTWPMRSELSNRFRASGSNALASSIVLSLRPRPESASTTDRRGFIGALQAELPDALRNLEQGQIAPVDLPQAAIGPGMAVFSRYSAVLEPDGKKMTVRSALARINEILDQVLNEQEGDFDSTSRFAIAWYRQHGYGVGKFGDADNLARARNTSVDTMDRDEILTSRAGNVQLIKPSDLSLTYDVLKDVHTSNWEAFHHLIKVLERDGIAPAGDFLQAALSRPDGAIDADLVKELAHLLFRIAEGNGWTKDALSFNTLVTSWPEILEVARSVKKPAADQSAFDFDEGDD